jgi:hypothetical protein
MLFPTCPQAAVTAVRYLRDVPPFRRDSRDTPMADAQSSQSDAPSNSPVERALESGGPPWSLPAVWPSQLDVNIVAPEHPGDPDPKRIRGRNKEIAAVLDCRSELRTIALLVPDRADADAAVGVYVDHVRIGTATKSATRYDQLCDVNGADGYCAAEVLLCIADDVPQASLFPPLAGAMTRSAVMQVLIEAGFAPAVHRDGSGFTTLTSGVNAYWSVLETSQTYRLTATWDSVRSHDEDYSQVVARESDAHKAMAAALRAAGYRARSSEYGVSVMGYDDEPDDSPAPPLAADLSPPPTPPPADDLSHLPPPPASAPPAPRSDLPPPPAPRPDLPPPPARPDLPPPPAT